MIFRDGKYTIPRPYATVYLPLLTLNLPQSSSIKWDTPNACVFWYVSALCSQSFPYMFWKLKSSITPFLPQEHRVLKLFEAVPRYGLSKNAKLHFSAKILYLRIFRFFLEKIFSKGKRENQTLETRKHEKRDATAAPLLWGGICGIPHASFRG